MASHVIVGISSDGGEIVVHAAGMEPLPEVIARADLMMKREGWWGVGVRLENPTRRMIYVNTRDGDGLAPTAGSKPQIAPRPLPMAGNPMAKRKAR